MEVEDVENRAVFGAFLLAGAEGLSGRASCGYHKPVIVMV